MKHALPLLVTFVALLALPTTQAQSAATRAWVNEHREWSSAMIYWTMAIRDETRGMAPVVFTELPLEVRTEAISLLEWHGDLSRSGSLVFAEASGALQAHPTRECVFR